MLNDMRLLDIVTRTGSSTVAEWTLSKYIRNLIQEAELYTTVGEKEREVPELRIKKKRKKKSKSKPRKVRKKS